VATLSKPPARLGVTHWSSRLLAKPGSTVSVGVCVGS
jgi:hypothetical protein